MIGRYSFERISDGSDKRGNSRDGTFLKIRLFQKSSKNRLMYCNPAKARKKNLSAEMLSPSFSNPKQDEKSRKIERAIKASLKKRITPFSQLLFVITENRCDD